MPRLPCRCSRSKYDEAVWFRNAPEMDTVFHDQLIDDNGTQLVFKGSSAIVVAWSTARPHGVNVYLRILPRITT